MPWRAARVIGRRALAAVIVVGALAALGPVLPAYPLTLHHPGADLRASSP